MDAKAAQKILDEHKYTLGRSSTSTITDPKVRAAIKAACKVIAAAPKEAK